MTRDGASRRTVTVQVDGADATVPEGATLLDACKSRAIEVPTLCYLGTLHPVNVCRLCVVELEGSRALVPACSRKAEPGMVVRTQSERVRHSRKMVLEFLASSVDLSTAGGLSPLLSEYGCKPERYGTAETVAQPAKIDNELYVRDYSKCVLCYRCVEACGADHQNTFAISVAGRGFSARISTEMNVPLPRSACVYCGNCIAVCPTGALMDRIEYDRRLDGSWDEARQKQVTTVCGYCGVGCTVRLHVQDNEIMKATSPFDHDVTLGNLCIKGRFGWRYVQEERVRSVASRGGSRPEHSEEERVRSVASRGGRRPEHTEERPAAQPPGPGE
jgi:predicted molibdopterin-dependent oxidoreductase YjgC